MDLLNKIEEAAAYVQSRSSHRPVIGVILGSGLGGFTEQMEVDQEIEYAKRKKSLFDMQVRIEGMKAYMKAKPMFIEEEKDAPSSVDSLKHWHIFRFLLKKN